MKEATVFVCLLSASESFRANIVINFKVGECRKKINIQYIHYSTHNQGAI